MANNTVRSVCPYCGVGCGIVMQVEDNRVVKVTGDKAHPANFGRLCTKGTTCGKAIAESGRMENAYLRQERSRDPVRLAMGSAISETAARLRTLLDNYGPDALSFYVSGQMSLEAQYLINKLAKGFVRTANIESNSRLCMASASSGYKLSLGADGPPGSYQDFDRSNLFFVIGANMADCHPILFLRMMDRVKAGAKLIVVDPRRSATADKADLFLPIKPGTDLALLNGLLHLLVKNGHTDPAFIAAFTEGWEAMPGFLEDYPPATVAEITGRVDELLDHGPESKHPRHLEQQRSVQPAPGHRLDLPSGQRAFFPDRATQCHGRPRDGLYGTWPARSAFGASRGGSCIHRGFMEHPPRQPAALGRCRHRGDVRTNARRPDQGLLDHLHQPGSVRAQSPDSD
jgi:predicted molibdopterin-dependent oxidoreductase YjgC